MVLLLLLEEGVGVGDEVAVGWRQRPSIAVTKPVHHKHKRNNNNNNWLHTRATQYPRPGRPTHQPKTHNHKSRALETKGNVREARRLHSMTFTSLSRAMSWMLKGPVMLSARAMADEIFFTCVCRCFGFDISDERVG